MKRSIELIILATALLLFAFATSLPAQQAQPGSPIEASETVQTPAHYPSVRGTLVIPESNKPQTVPAGQSFAANTNVEMFIPAGFPENSMNATGVPYYGYGYETPASLGCVYSLTDTPIAVDPSCNPNISALKNPTGGGKTIAIVDAYDDPSAESDSLLFSYQFGLPMVPPTVVYAITGDNSANCPGWVQTDYSGGWEMEEALDVEWAHAMAPSATIYLVEACTTSGQDLQQAVLVANNLVNCGITGITNTSSGVNTAVCGTTQNAGEVSMSWGGYERSGETGTSCTGLNDGCFTAPNVVYVAAAGDNPGTQWPGTSPNVVSAGGLSNRRNPATLNFVMDSAWVFGGDGQSLLEKIPSYQSSHIAVTRVCGTVWRCVPDLSFDADPYTGVWVYDTFPIYGIEYSSGWNVMGGTSVSSPALAGIINNAASRSGTWAATTNAELTTIYANLGTAYFSDIVSGYCGFYMGFTALTGYDLCTGVGAPRGFGGK